MGEGNFFFLKSNWPLLSRLGVQAEKNLYSDPNTTLIKLRMFGERIVDYIFEYDNLNEYSAEGQFNKLKVLEEEELMSERILKIFHLLRRGGNEAVHNSYSSLEDAKVLLALAHEAGVWFMQLYGKWDFKTDEFRLPPEEEETLIEDERKFITTDPFSLQNNQAAIKVWDAVRNAFRDNDCIAYWRYPIFSKRGERRKEPDILIVDREFGLIIIEVKDVVIDQIKSIEGQTWEYDNYSINYDRPLENAEDQLFTLLGYCDAERELRRRVRGRSIVVLPNISQEEWNNSNLVTNQDSAEIIFAQQLGKKSLIKRINDIKPVVRGESLDNAKWKSLISVLTGTILYRQKDNQDNIDHKSRGGVKKIIKEYLHKVDLKQEEIAKSIPPGAQRIRGIAGSGKSVLLAQKAVHMHLKNPEWKIALVFFTRSLYDATIKELDRWMRRFTNGQESYNPETNRNLEVLHAWGSKKQAGFYKEVCKHHGVKYLSAMDKRLGDRDPNEKLIKALQLFLEGNQEIDQIYDAILIDEAQDLVVDDQTLKYNQKQPFFWLAYRVLKDIDNSEQKRLIWAYDEAQSLNSLNIPTAPELFGNDPKFKRMVTGFHAGGIRKSEVMYKCYRTPGPILVAAHAIGMGLLRNEGILTGFTRQNDWESIGYEMISGSFRSGNEIILHRPKETTPNRVPEVWDDELISFDTYSTRAEELKALAQKISHNIQQEGLNPSRDILVIALGSYRDGFRLKTRIAKNLKKQGVDVYIPKAKRKNVIYPKYPNTAPNKFWDEGAVTISNIFRAKGNESYMVYVVGLDNIAKDESDISLRNQLFVALTRAKAWVNISGIGSYSMYQELEKVIESGNTFKFKFKRPVAARLNA